MKRKLVKQGGSALTVTLPIKWCEKYNLKAGDEVEVDEELNKAIIYAGNKTSDLKKEISIHLELENKRFCRSIIGALYRRGYDIINVIYNKEEMFKNVESAVNNIIGYEIFDRKPGMCVINSLIMESEIEFKNSLNKIINITKTLHSILREDYINKNYDRINEIEDYRISSWKLRDYSMRIIIKKNILNESSYSLSLITWVLEKISRNYKQMYEFIKEHKLEKNKELLEYYDQVWEYYFYFVESIFKSQFKRVEHINMEYYKLVKMGVEMINKQRKDQYLVFLLIDIVRKIQDVSSFLVIENMNS